MEQQPLKCTVMSSTRIKSKGQDGVNDDVIPIPVTRGLCARMSVSVCATQERENEPTTATLQTGMCLVGGGGGEEEVPNTPTFLKHLSGPTASRLVFFSQGRVGQNANKRSEKLSYGTKKPCMLPLSIFPFFSYPLPRSTSLFAFHFTGARTKTMLSSCFLLFQDQLN